jgi:signal transduction histidine kinase
MITITHRSIAQRNRVIDSLTRLLNIARDDTSKVNLLNQISRTHGQAGHFREAKKSVDEALSLAEKLNFRKGIATAHIILGTLAANDGKYSDAFKHHETALVISQQVHDKDLVALSYTNMGIVLRIIGNYPEALNNLLTALKIREELNDKRGVANVYDNIGEVYKFQRKPGDALNYHRTALKFFEEVGKNKEEDPIVRRGIATCYYNIGAVFDAQCKYADALEYLNRSLNIRRDINDRQGIAAAHNNIGSIQNKQGDFTHAVENFMKSKNIWLAIGNKRGESMCNSNIGIAYIHLGKTAEAREFLMGGLKIAREIGVKEVIRIAYSGLAQLDSTEGKFEDALVNFKMASNYQDSMLNESSDQRTAIMTELFERDKEILKLKSEKEISALVIKSKDDSLNEVELKNERIIAVNQMQSLKIEKDSSNFALKKLEDDQKLERSNKAKALQEIELKKQKQAKNYFIASLVLLALMSFLIYRNYHNRQKLKLLALRNKIASDLHDDVGSTLSSISIFSQMAQQQSKETIPMLETIGESSRNMLDAMADIVWTINPHNDQFEKIISRMKSFAFELLGAKNIDFEFFAEDDVTRINVPMEVRKNLYLIFKEATNNMVKYANANKATFAIKEEKNNLIMMIHDDGKGFDLNKPTEGNGLKNMKRRANEIGAHLVINSFPGNGTTIHLSVAV